MANIILNDHVGKTEEFKRPDHYDFMDASELRKVKWSGLRHNSISHRMELWIDGVVKGEYLPGEEDRMKKDFEDIFELHHVEFINDQQGA